MKMLLSILIASIYFESVAQETDSIQAIIFAPSGYSIPLRQKPNIDSKEIAKCNSVDSVLLLEYTGGNYYKVALASNPQKVGYMYISFLQYDETAVKKVNEYNSRTGSSLTLSYVKPPAKYKEQETKSIPNSTYSTSYPSNRTIHTGPRGGQYYINKNGNKTYIKKK